jgi:hypothetical protein
MELAREDASVVLADFKKDVVGHAHTVDGDDCALNSGQSGPPSDKMDISRRADGARFHHG